MLNWCVCAWRRIKRNKNSLNMIRKDEKDARNLIKKAECAKKGTYSTKSPNSPGYDFFFLHLPPSVIQDLSQFAILTAKVLFLQFIFFPHSYFRISQSLWTCLFFFLLFFLASCIKTYQRLLVLIFIRIFFFETRENIHKKRED